MTDESIKPDFVANAQTVFPDDPVEAGKDGEGGVYQITNADFVAAVFPCLPEGAFAAVSSKGGDPGQGGWPCMRADLKADGLGVGVDLKRTCAGGIQAIPPEGLGQS